MNPRSPDAARIDASVQLADGRKLAYMEWGERSDPPVLLFHGGGNSRYYNPSLGIAPTEPINLFTIDRPGFGGSDPQPRRTLRDWAQDVCAFADRVNLDRFAVIGFSDGGPHALACGVEIPERLTSLGVVSGVAPIPEPEEDLDDDERRFLATAAEDPEAAVQAYIATLDQSTDPAAFLRGSLPEVERRSLDDVAIREMRERSLREHALQGDEGDAWEWLAILDTAWGFRLEEVSSPVRIWHGLLDRVVPPMHAEFMVKHLPHAHMTLWPDEGHAGILARWPEVVIGVLSG